MEVPAVGVLVDGQRLGAGRQGDAGGHRGPGLVTASVRDGDRAGQVGAGRVGDVQRVGDPVRRGHPEADRVDPGRGHFNRVVEVLPGCRPAHVVGAAGRAGVLRVRGGFQVDPVGPVAVGAAVGGADAVGHAGAAGVVVGHLHRARHRGRLPAEGLVIARAARAAPARAQGEGHGVEVPAVGVLVQGERLLAGRQGDAGVDRGPGLVTAGVRDGDRAAQVGAGGTGQVQRVGDPVRGGHPEGDAVGPGGGDVDGVLEPLPGRRPAQVVGAAGRAGVLRVRGGFQVDPVGPVAVGAAVGGADVVAHPLAAGVVVRRLHGAGHRRRGATVGPVGGRGGPSSGSGRSGPSGREGRALGPGHHGQSGQNRDREGGQAPVATPGPG